jgi:hypothetical protein
MNINVITDHGSFRVIINNDIPSPIIPYSEGISYDDSMKYKFTLIGNKNGIPKIKTSFPLNHPT